MWIAILGLAVVLAAGKISVTAADVPLPQVMKALAGRLGSRVELEGDFSDLTVTVQLENQEPAQVVRNITAGRPVDYYVRGRGELIILHRRDRHGGPKEVYQAGPSPAEPSRAAATSELDRAVEFISSLGELTADEKKRLREELSRNW